MSLENFEILATYPCQYGETKVLEMKIDLVPGANPLQIPSETVESRPEGNITESDRQVVRTRSDRTFGEPLGVTSSACEKERWKDKMGNRSKRIKKCKQSNPAIPRRIFKKFYTAYKKLRCSCPEIHVELIMQ